MNEALLESVETGVRRGAGFKRWINIICAFLGLTVTFAVFAALTPETFLKMRTFETILRHTSIVGVAALGMTLIIIMGGIDLSVGSVVALGTVAIAWFLKAYGNGPGEMGVWIPLFAAALGVGMCAVCGALNGIVIVGLRVVPFIVTLAMMMMVRGGAKWWAGEQKIDAPAGWLQEITAALPPERWWMLAPPSVWLMLILAILVAVTLTYTRFGRHIFAIGSNEQTARLCGIAVNRTKIAVYLLGGVFAGLAGVLQFGRLTVGDPTVAEALELRVIAAVVIGGGSLFGGEGSVLGTLLGALIMTVIATGCSHMGWPNYVQEIVTGAMIALAVAADGLRNRRAD